MAILAEKIARLVRKLKRPWNEIAAHLDETVSQNSQITSAAKIVETGAQCLAMMARKIWQQRTLSFQSQFKLTLAVAKFAKY